MMRGKESDPKVRLIPVDLETDLDALPRPRQGPEGVSDRGKRISLGLLLALAAVIVAWALIGVDARTSGTAALFVDPDEVGPNLVLTATSTSEGWSFNFAEQSESATGDDALLQGATVDASGQWSASPTCDTGRCELVIARVEGSTERAVVTSLEAVDHVWHAEESGRLAWLEESTRTSSIVTGRLLGDGTLLPDSAGVSVAEGSDLAWWDTSGLVVASDGVSNLDESGEAIWHSEGTLREATSSFVLVEDTGGGWSMLDRRSGAVLASGLPSTPTVLVSRARADAPRSSITREGYRYSFGPRAPSSEIPIVLLPDFRQLPVGSSPGTRYRVLQDGVDRRLTIEVIRPVGFLTVDS